MTHYFLYTVCWPSWWPEARQLLVEVCLSSSVCPQTTDARLESQSSTDYSILLFLIDSPIIAKTATYYSQCDHLNTENTTVLKLP